MKTRQRDFWPKHNPCIGKVKKEGIVLKILRTKKNLPLNDQREVIVKSFKRLVFFVCSGGAFLLAAG